MSMQLIIKSASQRVEDFKLDCELEWTIGRVKEQIASLYPTKPLKEHQKLIYGGKLLPDHLPLKSVLNQVQEIHVMHLVCPFTPKEEVKPFETKETPASTSVFSAPNMTHPQMNPNFLISQSYTSNAPSIPPGVSPATDAVQQYLAMQQMYTQFMAQYLAQVHSGPLPPQAFQSAAASQPVPPEEPAARPPEAPRGADEGADYLFILSRALMLFGLLYYYSSLQRILLVVSVAMLLSIYVKLKRESRTEAHATAPEREEATDDREESQADARTLGAEEQGQSETSAASHPVVSEAENRASLSTVFALVSSFFSSLIPTDPVPVEVN